MSNISELKAAVEKHVAPTWKNEIIKELEDYIRVPNMSPLFDSEWATNGLLDKCVDMMTAWVEKQNVAGLNMTVERLEGRTPLIFITIDGSEGTQETVLMYGHLDKQPPLTESWEEGLHPHKPVMRGTKLYGRGGADDGYAIYAAVTSVKALQAAGKPHGRVVIVIEACEESGSPDLPVYIDHLKERIGTPSLIVCLDSGCGNYDQLWITTSLRGILVGDLKVNILEEGVHSGHASGIVPSSFRIARQLLSRIEDPATGEVLVKDLHVEIPAERVEQSKITAAALGNEVYEEFPWVEGAGPAGDKNDVPSLLLARTWKPALSVTGQDGMPALADAGNVLRTHTHLKLSMRLPPGVEGPDAAAALKAVLEKDPPYGAKVDFTSNKNAAGWESPALQAWLEKSGNAASEAVFGKPLAFLGEGGSIPFMGMLGKKFPAAQFFITGVLGPKSNAHGPNEFIDVAFAEKLTTCVSLLLADHYTAKH